MITNRVESENDAVPLSINVHYIGQLGTAVDTKHITQYADKMRSLCIVKQLVRTVSTVL
jgi:hypothetical protein